MGLGYGSHKEAITADLNWGMSDEQGTIADENEREIEADLNGITEEVMKNDVPNEFTEENSPDEGQIRRQPVWMKDYESGQVLSEEEDMVYLAVCYRQ